MKVGSLVVKEKLVGPQYKIKTTETDKNLLVMVVRLKNFVMSKKHKMVVH